MKQKIKEYMHEHSFERFLELTGDDTEHLTTVMNRAFQNVNWKDPRIIPTAFLQLKKAITSTFHDPVNTRISDYPKIKKGLNEIFHQKCKDIHIPIEYKTISDMGILCNYAISFNEYSKGYPIGIGKGRVKGGIYQDGKDVYLVFLTGTGIQEGQSYGIITDVLSGIETNSVYLDSILKAILEHIPQGADLILMGFSLGGMMVQQVMVQPCIYTNYHLNECVILGSPALCVEERDQAFQDHIAKEHIHRIICYHDIVPYLCVDYFLKKDYLEGQLPKEGTVYETLSVEYQDNYKSPFTGTHLVGYIKDEQFKHYDVLGYDILYNEKHTLILKLDEVKYFASPSIGIGIFGAIE